MLRKELELAVVTTTSKQTGEQPRMFSTTQRGELSVATVLDLPRIPLARPPHLITLDAPAHCGVPQRTHVAAVWGDLRSASSVIVQPMSPSVATDEQAWRSCAAKTSLLATGLAPGISLVQWLGRTIPFSAELSRHRNDDTDPIDRDSNNLLEFDAALSSALPRRMDRTYLGYGASGYLIAETCKRGLAPSAVAFVDTPGLGRQPRRGADGAPVIVDGTLIHARDPITCMRDLNPVIANIPVLVLSDGSCGNELNYSSPPQHLTDVIVATTHSENGHKPLPRSVSPAELRRYVFATQQHYATSSSEGQRNLRAFLNGELHLIRAANRTDWGDSSPLVNARLLRMPTVPLFNRDHTGDNDPWRNTRPFGRGHSGERPPSKPDGYHARAAERRY